MTKIYLKDLGYDVSNIPTDKSDFKLINIMENYQSPLYFIKEGFNLMDSEMYAFHKFNQNEKQLLVEAVSRSNIEKAEFILEHNNDKLIKLVKLSKGDVTKFKYYEILKQMIEDLQKASPHNQEVVRAAEVISELENKKVIYIKAFNNGNIFRKTLYFSSLLCAVYSIIKEHVSYLDITDSKNQAKVVMVEDNHGMTTDKNTIKVLNSSLMLLKSKYKEDKLAENTQLTEWLGMALAIPAAFAGGAAIKAAGLTLSGTASAAASGISTLASGLSTAGGAIGSGINTAIATAPTAGAYMWTAAQFALYATGVILTLYVITKLASVSILRYLESYDHIKMTADNSSLSGDRAISKLIDGMASIKNTIKKVFMTDKSKNVSEYMKDINKDIAVIKKSESKRKEEEAKDIDTSHSFF